jgi:capsid portal protein
MKATVIGPVLKDNVTTGKARPPYGGADSNVLPMDFLDAHRCRASMVEPPFDPLVLAMIPEHSTELAPAIEAMSINIDGFGHRLIPRVKIGSPDIPNEVKAAVAKEYAYLTNFFEHCCVEDSFNALRRKTRHDLETTGNAYWEVIRNPVTRKIQGLNHIPGHQMRLGVIDKAFTEYEQNRLELADDGSVKLVQEAAQKRFRSYVQAKLGTLSRSFGPGRGHPVRWFKEYMDPRVMNNEDGTFFSETQVKEGKAPEERRANEVIHWKLYSPRSPYGLPRYIGNLITIFGDRAAEEINFITLRNNNIPSMAVCVSNGQLTEGSIGRIQEFVETQIQGSENYSRFLIIEAEGQYEGQDGGIKVDIKPLTDQQMRDQMFQAYGKNNGDKIRRSFRLPPIFVGMASDYSKATAEESRRLADEQIFKPERDEFDNRINKFILAEMGALYHKFVSNGPNVTDDQDMIQVLMAAERTGALTPKIARGIVGNITNQELPDIDPAKLDPDVPFSLQLAERVKNEAAMETGSPEVGSQVTALKRAALSTLMSKRDELQDELDYILSLNDKNKG